MKRARKLSDLRIKTVVSILDGWQGKLTWEALIDRVEGALKDRYTRQALDKHVPIYDAFIAAKKRLSEGQPATTSSAASTPEMQAALERIQRLEAEVQRLTFENKNMTEQFVKFIYNASCHGISKELLNRPLPVVERERSLGIGNKTPGPKQRQTRFGLTGLKPGKA